MSFESGLAEVNKNSKGALMKMSDKSGMDVHSFPTGILPLDLALGIGGLPEGRIIELYGPESSGKSTIAQHAIAEAQRAGGKCVYVDAEHAMDPVYADAIGVDVDELYVSQPDSAEEALGIVDTMAKAGGTSLIVVDSVAALVPRAEIEGDMGDSHMGLQARIMGQALRKIKGNLNNSKTTCIFINQLREKIGVMFGSPETTPGGKALKFYASVRLDVRRKEPIKEGVEIVGNRTKVKVVKNKVAPPLKVCEFDIMYGQGVSLEGAVLELAVEHDIVSKSGAWYSYGDNKNVAQGKEAGKAWLRDNPVFYKEIDSQVRSLFE